MKIGILGAGATGCNVGGHLKKGGAEVWLIDTYKEHMEKIAKDGLIWVMDDGTESDPIFFDGAVHDPADCGVCDLVILLTKCQFTREAVENAKPLFGPKTTVITLQNGVGSVEILQEFFQPDRLGYGIMNIGGAMVGPGKTVMYRAPDHCIVFKRAEGGINEPFRQLVDYFHAGGMPVDYTEAADDAVWTKLGVNCMYNMPCGVIRINSYDFVMDPDGNALLEDIVDEVVAVAVAAGYSVRREDVLKMREMTIKTANKIYPSGAQDMMHKRSTEVEFLNGAVARRGAQLGVPTPINATIARMARVVERNYDILF